MRALFQLHLNELDSGLVCLYPVAHERLVRVQALTPVAFGCINWAHEKLYGAMCTPRDLYMHCELLVVHMKTAPHLLVDTFT